MTIKSLISTAALIAGMSAIAPTASAADWSLSTDFVTEYVFRGSTFGQEAIQPGAEVSLDNGLTLGVWASTGVGEESVSTGDEVDFYAGYTVELGGQAIDLGATYYHYPQGGDIFATDDGDAGSYEFSVGTGFDLPLEPYVTAAYDVTFESLYLGLGLGNSAPIGEKTSFDYGFNLGMIEPNEGDGYTYADLSGAVSYAFTDAASGYIGLNGVTSSEDTLLDEDGAAESSSVWLSMGLSTGF